MIKPRGMKLAGHGEKSNAQRILIRNYKERDQQEDNEYRGEDIKMDLR
jgi:hypothetical protein